MLFSLSYNITRFSTGLTQTAWNIKCKSDSMYVRSFMGVSQYRQAPILLKSDYFCANRPDLEKKGLLWGVGEHKTKEQFKSIMRIELRKYAPQHTADNLLILACFIMIIIILRAILIVFRFIQRNLLKAEQIDPAVDILSTLQASFMIQNMPSKFLWLRIWNSKDVALGPW